MVQSAPDGLTEGNSGVDRSTDRIDRLLREL